MSYLALLFCPDEKTARVVTQVLTDLEFSIEVCSEPFAAVKKLMGQHFDAIVVDCENEQNATLLFKSARNSGSNQSALAVAVVEGQAGVAKAFRIGANLVLTKPINVEQSKGTLRVARGLLRKADSYKPPVTTPATQPAAPTFKAARPAAPATVTPKPGFSGFPAQRTLIEPTVSDKTSSAFELQPDPTPEPEPTEAAMLESMSDSIESQRPSQPSASSAPSKEYPWQPVSKPLSEPMASALKRAAEAASKTPAVPPSAPKPAAPPSRPADSAKSWPAAHSMPSAQGSASAPAPARETPRSIETFGPKPAASKPLHSELKEAEAPRLVGKVSALDELPEETPLFSAMQGQQKASGGGKKIFLVAVLAMVAISSTYYYISQHPEIAPAFLQKFTHTQTAPAPVQTQVPVPVPVKPQAAVVAQTATPAPTAAAPAETSDQPSDSATANWQIDPIETSEASAPPKRATKPSAAKSASTIAAKAKLANPTPAPGKKTLTVAKAVAPVKTKAPAPETVPTIAPPALGISSGATDKAIAGIASAAGSAVPAPLTPQTLRISQGVTQGLLIKRVAPIYPLSAKQMHIQGTVELQATLGKDGKVSSVRALSGDPLLARAAIDAVKQWKYKPYTLNSEPVEIQTQITVNFKLP